MQKIIFLLVLSCSLTLQSAKSQELMDLLGDNKPQKEFTTATFKTTHIILGQSSENIGKGDLNFIISHHFGSLNSGAGNFWGFDQSTIRLGVEYGISNRLEVGLGRSSFQKTINGYLKFKIIRQSNKTPLSLSYFGDMAVNTLPWTDPNRTNYFTSRLSFVNQLLIARKFNNNLSLQLMPTHVHKNLVKRVIDQNDAFAVGAGGRFKFTERMSVNAEYYYLLPGQTAKDFNNSLSLGVDIETGGHVFQLFLTNSQPLFERGFVTETQGNWAKENIFFGFNIIRTFTIVKPKTFRKS
ncbi:MAG: DUF5777 family beta-barrel protein [Bacteroidota bacterium]